MSQKRLQLAIIKEVGFGMRDFPNGRPGLWFSTYISDCEGALQCFQGAEMEQILIDAKVYDVKELEGKPCYVEAESGFVHFVRMAKI